MNEELTQEEIELRDVLMIFFAKVVELPMIEQIRILADFQGFVAEQRRKSEQES